MKKLLFFTLIVLTSITSFSQKLDNEFYFRFGYSVPSWNQYGLDKDSWSEDVKRYGGQFEVGSIFMVKTFTPSKNMAVGINIDYLYSNFCHFYNDEAGMEQNLATFRIGSKIGPSFSYSPVDKMAIDVFAKADFAWATATVPFETKIDDADDFYVGKTAVGFSTGLNFRYNILMLGIEYNVVSPKLESDDYEGEYMQELIEYFIGEGDSGEKSKLPAVNFTIGLSF